MIKINTRELIYRIFDELKTKHQFDCGLSDNPTDNFMMEYDWENNVIVYDISKLEETYREGSEIGFYKYDIERFLLFCLVHELGHYYDYKENKNAFNFSSKEEYIQIELNGIQKAKRIIPVEYSREFHLFNRHIIESYKTLDFL